MARNKQIRSKDGSSIYIEHVPNVTHKICSLFPMDIHLEEGYLVPACDDKTPPDNAGEIAGTKYSFVEVRPKISRIFVGGGNNDTWENRLDVTAYDHALDLLGHTFSDSTDEPGRGPRAEALEGRGLFVPKGDEPTVSEIKAAQRKQAAFYEVEAQRAQSYWAQYRRMDNISEVAILAAKSLGHKYEWMAGESRLEKKSESDVLAEAIAKLIPALQQQGAAPAAVPAQRK